MIIANASLHWTFEKRFRLLLSFFLIVIVFVFIKGQFWLLLPRQTVDVKVCDIFSFHVFNEILKRLQNKKTDARNAHTVFGFFMLQFCGKLKTDCFLLEKVHAYVASTLPFFRLKTNECRCNMCYKLIHIQLRVQCCWLHLSWMFIMLSHCQSQAHPIEKQWKGNKVTVQWKRKNKYLKINENFQLSYQSKRFHWRWQTNTVLLIGTALKYEKKAKCTHTQNKCWCHACVSMKKKKKKNRQVYYAVTRKSSIFFSLY